MSTDHTVYFYPVDDIRLDKNQRVVYDNVKRQVKQVKDNSYVKGEVIVVQGGPGTGKTLCLKKRVNYIRCLGNDSVVVLAYTGAAAKIVNGWTITSYLKTGRGNKFLAPYSGEDLLSFKKGEKVFCFCSLTNIR